MKSNPHRAPRPLADVLDDIDNPRVEERRMLLALASAKLAIAAFRRGERILERLPKTAFYDDADDTPDKDRSRRFLDGAVPAEVADSLAVLEFFTKLLGLTTGLSPSRELVQALHRCRPRRAEGCADAPNTPVRHARLRRKMKTTWWLQVGLWWLQVTEDCLKSYNDGLIEGTSDMPSATAVAAVAALCMPRHCLASSLLRANFTGGDIGAALEWASVGEDTEPATTAELIDSLKRAQAGSGRVDPPAKAEADADQVPAPIVAAAAPVRWREFL